ncbi:hypothetical protein JXL21_06820 [Candidatus Bathyarchaeota archaeon]|nr:hypothetical protein [Candidatus Bathyarchaeota archaeon]
MRKRSVIPIHLRVTILDEFTEIRSSPHIRRASFEEIRSKIRERAQSTEGVHTESSR